MGRHPDSRQPADPQPPVVDTVDRPTRSRPARLLSGALAVALAVALVGWAGLAVAAAMTGGRSALIAVGPSASHAVASEAPSPGSPVASPDPLPTPSTSPPIGAGEPATRPRVTTIPLDTRLQAELDRMRTRLGVPGASATVILRDGTTWTGSSGSADVAGGVDVTADTAFAVGSVSKTYTAALILALAGDGLIDIDQPAATYLTGLPLDRRITVRMLLDHTSGLDDFFLHANIDRALQGDRGAAWSVKRTLGYVAKPYFAPGTSWHYSNTNYVYLGLIAERVTGSTLGVALHDRFFGPLGLDGTWYQPAEKPRAPTAHGYRFASPSRKAPPIDLSDGSPIVPFTSVVTASGGAGSIAATSADAARWARLLYTGEVLGPATTALMLDGVAGTAGYAPRVPYGLGVQAVPIDGRPSVGHSGRLLGFRAAVRHLPAEATTVAVLTNQSREDPGIIVRALLSVVFEPEPPCLRCQNAT